MFFFCNKSVKVLNCFYKLYKKSLQSRQIRRFFGYPFLIQLPTVSLTIPALKFEISEISPEVAHPEIEK